MLRLDPVTLLFTSALLTVLCGVYFILNTVFGISDRAGRVWTLSFLSGMIVTSLYIVWGLDEAAWWAIAVGNGMFTLAAGMFWSGARVFNGRHTLAVYPVAAAVAVGGFAVLKRDTPGGWGGTSALFLSVVVFCALAAVEVMRGVGRTNLNGRIFSTIMGLAALDYLARLVAFLAWGPTNPVFATWFGTVAATTVFIVLTFCASVTLTVLRIQYTPRGVASDDSGPLLLTTRAFDTVARGWLSRAVQEQQGLALAQIRLHGLDEIAVAFGGQVRDGFVDDFASVVAASMPTLSLPARAADDTVLILFPAPDAPAARADVTRIATAAETRPTGPTGVPLTIGISLAHTADVGYDMASLEREIASRRTTVTTTGLGGAGED